MLRLIVVSSVAACSLATNTKTRVLIEKATIKQFAHDTGIASLLEREGHNMNLGENKFNRCLHLLAFTVQSFPL